MGEESGCHCCKPACKGIKLILVGLILFANEFYFKLVNTWFLFAGLLALKGLFVMVMHGKCMCNKNECCKMQPEEKHHKK